MARGRGSRCGAGYRDGLPHREAFTARVRELLRVGSVGLPTWRGTTRFSMRRDPDQEHAVLYVADQAISDTSERALIDPA